MVQLLKTNMHKHISPHGEFNHVGVSPSGMGMRKSYDYKTNYWSVIPVGIPSKIIIIQSLN